jgi:hypothetical protein
MTMSISFSELRSALQGSEPPLIIDVRKQVAFETPTDIAGALRREPDAVESWRKELPKADSVVVYCVPAAKRARESPAHLTNMASMHAPTSITAPRWYLGSMELGNSKSGRWRTNGNELCMLRNPPKPEEECFEVWSPGNEIELRRDGVTVVSAFLRTK